MMKKNYWTMENVNNLIKVGDFSKDTCGQSAIVSRITKSGVEVIMCCGNSKAIYIEDMNKYSFYDYSTLQLIEPPKPRAYEIVAQYYELGAKHKYIIIKPEGKYDFYKRVPNTPRYKKYNDGELEVIEDEDK